MSKKVYICLLFLIECTLYSQDIYQIRVNNQGVERRFELDNEYVKNSSNPSNIDFNSLYLNRNFLKKPKEVREYLDSNELNHKNIKIKSRSGYYVHGELFDRKSDTLLVIGSGFPTPREQMVPFLYLFPQYDILFIDYIGQGLDHISQTWIGSFTHRFFGVDLCATSLGSCDETDLIEVVNLAKQDKTYAHCYGLALCHSASIFVKANLFEKLIIDGCWPSIERVIKKVARDPSIIFGKYPPSSPCEFITYKDWFQNFACYLVELLTNLKLSQIKSIEEYLPHLKIPILFFQSRQDCYCSLEQFESLWKCVRSDKVAVLTPHAHGKNYFDGTRIYHMIATKFFNSEDLLNDFCLKS